MEKPALFHEDVPFLLFIGLMYTFEASCYRVFMEFIHLRIHAFSLSISLDHLFRWRWFGLRRLLRQRRQWPHRTRRQRLFVHIEPLSAFPIHFKQGLLCCGGDQRFVKWVTQILEWQNDIVGGNSIKFKLKIITFTLFLNYLMFLRGQSIETKALKERKTATENLAERWKSLS